MQAVEEGGVGAVRNIILPYLIMMGGCTTCMLISMSVIHRMATICKRLKDPLAYLEQVRQHLGRLPSIDPNTRTLIICGYPNVGKSSFLKSVTRADVDVQPYAFTTKSLYVGHFDYKYLRFQAIDTPGILDHPLEEMNTIEMQSITAIAHLRSAVLYFVDLSEQCGYTIEAQVKLYHSIKPLFANKLVFLVVNKIDAMRPEDLPQEQQDLLASITKNGEVEMLKLSCHTEEGVMDVRNTACERLLAARVDQKLKAAMGKASSAGTEVENILSRIHVARPMGGVEREPFIPEAALARAKYDKTDPERRKLERDIEVEEGGAGVYNINLKKNYLLDNPEWKMDKIPEVFNGKNVYDFIDPEIERKLEELEAEEEALEKSGFYDSEEEIEDDEEVEIRQKAEYIREKHQLIRNAAKSKKALKNRAIIPRSKGTGRPVSEMEEHLDNIGMDPTLASARARAQSKARGRSTAPREDADVDMMDIDGGDDRKSLLARAKSRARSASNVNRRDDGIKDEGARSKADRMAKLAQKKMNRMARQGEGDRHTTVSLQKYLVAGKRGLGKNQRR